MNCEEARRLLHPYNDRELGLETSLQVEAHLEGCGACRAIEAELVAARRAATAALPYHRAPRALEAAIRARVASHHAGRKPARLRWHLLAVPVLAVAAATGWIGARHVAAPMDAARASERVVYHITSSENARVALRNLSNHIDASPGARVVVVAHNAGVEFLLAGARDGDGVAYEAAVEQLTRRGVEFRVCGNTLAQRGIEPRRVIAPAVTVPSGIAEIARLQTREGFAYLRL